MAAYTQGLAYQLDPVTLRNAAFPKLPESTPSSTTNVSYDSGTASAVSSSSGGLVYNSSFGINPEDFAVYFELKLTSGGDPLTQILSGTRIFSLVTPTNVTSRQIGIGTWFTGQPYLGADSIEYDAPTSLISVPSAQTSYTYHWKFTTPFSSSVSGLTIYDGSPIWDSFYSYLLIWKANSSTGFQIYANGTLRSAGTTGPVTPITASQLKLFYFINNLNNSGNIALRRLNVYSNASQLDYSSMATVSPSPGILPTSYTSGTSRLRKYFANSGVPTPTTNVALTGLEARFDKHRFYYPRPNKMHFTLRGGKNG